MNPFTKFMIIFNTDYKNTINVDVKISDSSEVDAYVYDMIEPWYNSFNDAFIGTILDDFTLRNICCETDNYFSSNPLYGGCRLINLHNSIGYYLPIRK